MTRSLLTRTRGALLTLGLAGAGLTLAQSGVPALPPGTPTSATPSTTPVTAPATTNSGYTMEQLQAVLPLLEGLKTLQTSAIDQTRGRVVVGGLSAVDRLTLIQRLRAANLPLGIVDYGAPSTTGTVTSGGSTGTVTQTPTTPTTPPAATTPARPSVTTLPAARSPQLTQPHAAALTGPTSVRAGEGGTWSFALRNTGTQAIRLQHGACDVRFEVVNAAGQVVRPDPKNTLCTMQIVMTDVAPGQSREVQKVVWDGKDASGRAVSAGTYTLRAVFNGPAYIRATDLTITVR